MQTWLNVILIVHVFRAHSLSLSFFSLSLSEHFLHHALENRRQVFCVIAKKKIIKKNNSRLVLFLEWSPYIKIHVELNQMMPSCTKVLLLPLQVYRIPWSAPLPSPCDSSQQTACCHPWWMLHVWEWVHFSVFFDTPCVPNSDRFSSVETKTLLCNTSLSYNKTDGD